VSGDFRSVRVLVMVAVIWAIFQMANDRFLSAINLTNLMLQITAVGMISVGVTLVLLLGEIDLSVAAVSGLAAGVTAVLNVKSDWPPNARAVRWSLCLRVVMLASILSAAGGILAA